MTTGRARQLRRNPTEPERKLWALLHPLRAQGHHFRRQHPIGPYYADFACIPARLIIEADGDTHASQPDYDVARDTYLRSRGFRVLRLWNNDITSNPDGVFQVIVAALGDAPTPTPVPSPSEGGGRPRTRKRRIGLSDLAARTGPSVLPSPVGAGAGGGGATRTGQRAVPIHRPSSPPLPSRGRGRGRGATRSD